MPEYLGIGENEVEPSVSGIPEQANSKESNADGTIGVI